MSEALETRPGAAGRSRRRWSLPFRSGREGDGERRRGFHFAPAPRVPLAVVGTLTVVAGVVLRFYAPTPLWLDETISVNISRLPIGQIPTALSHDGAPPLYYLLLHFWMLVWGQGDVAVRALSGVISVGALPLFWFAGRRVGGRTVAWVTFFLGVTSPFAIYYATTARMYSLMILWGLLGFLALVRALEAPTTGRLIALAVSVAGMLYTHYWALYLVAITGAWLVYQIWRHRRGLPIRTTPTALRRALVAVAAGSLLFAPWVPIFVFQTLHTGTPWTSAAGPADLLGVFADYAGSGPWADLLAFLYFGLIVLGVFGRRADIDIAEAARLSLGLPDPLRSDPLRSDPLRSDPLRSDPDGSGLDRSGLDGSGPDGSGPDGSGATAAPDRPAAGPVEGANAGPDRSAGDPVDGAGAGPGPDGAGREGFKDDAALIASGLELARPRRSLRARTVAAADRAVGFVGFGPGGAGASARRRQPGRGVTLVLQPNARALPVAGVLVGTLILAVVAGAVAQAAFVARYTAVVLPLFLLLTALGVGVLGRRRLVGGMLAVLCVAGLLTGLGNNGEARSQARAVADVLNVDARPGDLVVYCPDQLGPAVDRLLTVPAVSELTFPRAIGAQRVDWVNYRAVIDRTDVETFAQTMIDRLDPGHTLFLVWNDGYPGLGHSCANLQSWLALLLGQGAVLVHQNRSFYENENLTRYPS